MNYKKNFFRKRIFPGKGVLLINDQSYWVFLTFKEYKQFLNGNLDSDLFHKLEKNFMIITDDNEDRLIEAQRRLLWNVTTGTSLHIINISSRCNMNCDYCYANRVHPSAKGYDMTEETAEKVVDFIFQTPAKDISIEFIGGEPLLNFDILKFIVKLSKEKALETKKKVTFSLTTNATNLDEEKIEFFSKINTAPCISLDGPKWIHDKHRVYWGGGGTYDLVTKWIKYIRDNYPDMIIVGMPTLTKDSLPHYKEIIDEYVKWGFPKFPIRPTSQVRTAGVNWNKLGYTVDEFLTFWENAVNYLLELDAKGVKLTDVNTLVYAFYILGHSNVGMTDMEVPCGAIFGQIVYNYNGDIYPCDEARSYPIFKLGSVYKDSYKDIVSSKKAALLFNAATNLSTAADADPYYPFANSCFVDNYATQGTIVPNLSDDFMYQIHRRVVDRLFERILFEKGFKDKLINWFSPDDTPIEKSKYGVFMPLRKLIEQNEKRGL